MTVREVYFATTATLEKVSLMLGVTIEDKTNLTVLIAERKKHCYCRVCHSMSIFDGIVCDNCGSPNTISE